MSEQYKDPKDYNLDNGYMSIHELLAANGVNQRILAESLDREEAIENQETEDEIKADIESQKQRTDLAKERLIKEMKGDLGKVMMKNPSKVEIIKKPWHKRLGEFFKKLFTRF